MYYGCGQATGNFICAFVYIVIQWICHIPKHTYTIPIRLMCCHYFMSVVSDAHMATSFCCCSDAQTTCCATDRVDAHTNSQTLSRLNDGSNGRRPSSEHLPRLANIVMTTQAAVARTLGASPSDHGWRVPSVGDSERLNELCDEVFVRAPDAGAYKFRETCDFYLVVGGEGTLKPKWQHNT